MIVYVRNQLRCNASLMLKHSTLPQKNLSRYLDQNIMHKHTIRRQNRIVTAASMPPSPGTPPYDPFALVRALLKTVAPYIIGVALFAGSLIGIAPYVLSHPVGLHAMVAAINTLGQVRLSVDAVSLGWNRPVSIQNLKLVERSIVRPVENAVLNKLQFIEDSSTSEEEGEGEEDSSHSFLLPRRATLFAADTITTTASLWEIVFQKKHTDIIVTRPVLDSTLNAKGEVRISRFLEDVRLSPPPLHQGSASAKNKRQSNKVAPMDLQIPGNTPIKLTGEIRSTVGRSFHIFITDGSLLAPTEMGQLLGKRAHVEILQGAAAMKEGTEEMGVLDDESLQWTREAPTSEPPWGAGVAQTPIAIRLDAQHVSFILEGWKTSKQYTFLRQPVESTAELTPALAQTVLSRFNPLFKDIVGLRGGTKVQGKAWPADGIWPSTAINIRMEPIRVALAQGSALRQALDVLAATSAKFKAPHGAAVEASLSPLVAQIDLDQRKVHAQRVDIQFGRSLRLVSWGKAHLEGDGPLEMTVAIPTSTLSAAGLGLNPPLNDEWAVRVGVGGTVDAPKVALGDASKQLGALVVYKSVQGVSDRFGGLVSGSMLEKAGAKQLDYNFRMPPLPGDF